MRYAGLALAAFLFISQPTRTPSEDRGKTFLIGTYLGYEMQDGDTNGTGATMHRTYYVRTDDGTWSLVSFAGAAAMMEHTNGWAPGHSKTEKSNLLDSLKHGEKFAFRVEPDHRIGATKNSYHVFIPQAEDPKKEDKFDAELTPIPNQDAAQPPTDNVKAMCDAHRFTPEQEKQYCASQ